MSAPDRVERLELDVDTRLVSLWALLDELHDAELTLELVARFMRAAYALGYSDALTEGVRGRLHRENGYRVPARGEVGR